LFFYANDPDVIRAIAAQDLSNIPKIRCDSREFSAAVGDYKRRCKAAMEVSACSVRVVWIKINATEYMYSSAWGSKGIRSVWENIW
jgi:hypothetical protein